LLRSHHPANFAELANFCFQSRVQISYASASGIGRSSELTSASLRNPKHQAHQFSACCLDGKARGGGGSVEVIDAARFAVGLKQFVNRVAVR
jgi:hypothetical protein